MKRNFIFAVLFGACILVSILIFGCGQSTQETSTTTSSVTTSTLSPGAAAGDAATDAVIAIIGISQTSQSIGVMAGVGSSITTSSIASAFSAAASTASPPAAFFDPLPSDGWISIDGTAFSTGESVRLRMFTRNGDLINASYVAARKIASLEGFNWNSMLSGGSPPINAFFGGIYLWLTNSPAWNPASPSTFYSSSTKFVSGSSFWDYVVWAHIATHPSTEAACNPAYIFYPDYNFWAAPLRAPLAAYPKFGTPEAAASDHIGTQEAHITGTHPDGSSIDLTQTVSTDAEGKPVSATGSGTITRADSTVMTINSMTMTFSDGAPSSGTMDISAGAPDNLHMVMTITSSGAATGTVYDTSGSSETELGTIVLYDLTTAGSTGHHGYFLPAGLPDIEANRNYF